MVVCLLLLLLQVLDVCGGVMLAWEMNGQELLPDHGYPVSTITTRSWHPRLVAFAYQADPDKNCLERSGYHVGSHIQCRLQTKAWLSPFCSHYLLLLLL